MGNRATVEILYPLTSKIENIPKWSVDGILEYMHPLMLYVSKMIPTSDKGRLFAFVRMFAGKVSTGLKVRIMGPNLSPGENKDLNVKSVQRTIIWMLKKQETVEDILFGNTVALVGLDQYITKNAAVTNKKEVDAHPVKAMKFSISPVSCVALVEGLKRLDKYDPMVVCTIEKSGEHTDDFMGGAKIIKSDLVVSFAKTVLENLYREARPLEEGLAEAIDDGRIVPRDDHKGSSKIMSEEFSWEKDLAKKICCFGLATTGPNMVVDMCKGWASKEGALAKERMRGICFEVCDVALHVDTIHRVGGQVIPNARRAFARCVFDHWDMMSLDPLEAGSQAATLVTKIRKRKGLKEQMTPLSEFEDKL
ncbi:hypothetical protein UlMin_028350 [Ulmus minor]